MNRTTAVLLAALMGLGGCGGETPPVASVEGRVTLPAGLRTLADIRGRVGAFAGGIAVRAAQQLGNGADEVVVAEDGSAEQRIGAEGLTGRTVDGESFVHAEQPGASDPRLAPGNTFWMRTPGPMVFGPADPWALLAGPFAGIPDGSGGTTVEPVEVLEDDGGYRILGRGAWGPGGRGATFELRLTVGAGRVLTGSQITVRAGEQAPMAVLVTEVGFDVPEGFPVPMAAGDFDELLLRRMLRLVPADAIERAGDALLQLLDREGSLARIDAGDLAETLDGIRVEQGRSRGPEEVGFAARPGVADLVVSDGDGWCSYRTFSDAYGRFDARRPDAVRVDGAWVCSL